jgi:hypothetical protein
MFCAIGRENEESADKKDLEGQHRLLFVALISRRDTSLVPSKSEQSIGQENEEANARAMDENNALGIAQAFEGKDASRQDLKANEADDWCVTPASPQARYWPRPPALEVHRAADPLSQSAPMGSRDRREAVFLL